jgi:CheY-like chemotaxis protein
LESPVLKIVENGAEAVQAWKQEDWDVLLMDINMPVMDGWQFLDSLGKLENPPLVHVVIVTSSIDTIDKRKATKYPQVIGFFEKPLTQENCLQMKQFEALKHYFIN